MECAPGGKVPESDPSSEMGVQGICVGTKSGSTKGLGGQGHDRTFHWLFEDEEGIPNYVARYSGYFSSCVV